MHRIASEPSASHIAPTEACAGIRICLFLDPTRIYLWHVWLAEALADAGRCHVSVQLAPEGRPLPSACSLLFELERLAYGLASESAVGPAGDRLKPFLRPTRTREEGGFDVVIDLAGGEGRLPTARRILVPYFGGLTGEIGAIARLIERQVPAIEIDDSAFPGSPWTGRPATTDREVFATSLANILSAAVYLLRQAVFADDQEGLRRETSTVSRVAQPPRWVATGAMLRASAAITHKAIRLLKILTTGGRAWGVALRPAASRALLVQGTASFNVLRDDGHRYYADPFPFRWRGRTFLFVEEYPYATGRGCIAVSEVREDGTAATPRPVLEEPHHLSYPFVFEQDGQIWMIPESGAAHGVHLYRAEAFPFKWKREACLVPNRQCYDATLVRHDGLLWLFACERSWSSSSWDVLTLFRSDRLTGAWEPHRRNPVLVDASTSRPAGASFTWRGEQLRPAQDCSEAYGGAISLCRIDALGPDTFHQTKLGTIHCGPHGCHTYNHDEIEVIDAFTPRGLGSIDAFYHPVSPTSDLGRSSLEDHVGRLQSGLRPTGPSQSALRQRVDIKEYASPIELNQRNMSRPDGVCF